MRDMISHEIKKFIMWEHIRLSYIVSFCIYNRVVSIIKSKLEYRWEQVHSDISKEIACRYRLIDFE